jgi:hypothetical protein
VISGDLRDTSSDLRLTIWDIWVVIGPFRNAISHLWKPIDHFRVALSHLRESSGDPREASDHIRETSGDLRVVIDDLSVAIDDLRVVREGLRAESGNARVDLTRPRVAPREFGVKSDNSMIAQDDLHFPLDDDIIAPPHKPTTVSGAPMIHRVHAIVTSLPMESVATRAHSFPSQCRSRARYRSLP